MLTYTMGKPKIYKGEDISVEFHKIYIPPIKEFAIDRILIDSSSKSKIPNDGKISLRKLTSPSILLCLETNDDFTNKQYHQIYSMNSHQALPISKGSVFFIGANVDANVILSSQNNLHIQLWRASCNI